MSKAAKKPRKGATGYKMPEPLPNGEIFEDMLNQKWKIGPSIGKGGFGEIYSAQEYSSKISNKFPYVIKVEPHENGPLYVEMQFYIRNGKASDIKEFKEEKKLTTFGMPVYIGAGTHQYKGEKFRFIVMEKFGSDIWKLFLQNNRCFPEATVYHIGIQILDILEYIHNRSYVHADVKGSNILVGATKETQNQVYLVDFGLCSHFSTSDKPDLKKAHNGTIEYLSRDAHLGVQSRRGDLEILAYNLIQWLGGVLPWEKDISDPKIVQLSKEENMKDIPKFLKTCFTKDVQTARIASFLEYIKTLTFDAVPDYHKLHNILLLGLQDCGGSLTEPLKFKSTVPKSPKRKGTPKSSTPEKKQKLTKKPTVNEAIEEDAAASVPSTSKLTSVPTTSKLTKRGKGPVKQQHVIQEDDNEDSVEPPKKQLRKPKSKVTAIEKKNDTVDTAEMLKIKNKIQENGTAAKKPKGNKKGEEATKENEIEDTENDNEEMLKIKKKIQDNGTAAKPKDNKKGEEPSKENGSSDVEDTENYNEEMLKIKKKIQVNSTAAKPKDDKKGEEPSKENGSSDVEDTENYNEEMLKIKKKIQDKGTAAKKRKDKKKAEEASKENGSSDVEDTENYNEEMIRIKNNIEKGHAKDRLKKVASVDFQGDVDESGRPKRSQRVNYTETTFKKKTRGATKKNC